ncbi:hypothetical protein [Paenibacillus solani]|uniref:hypothetical protein n=1 Tax=Paenibacillus solani TaxID=1705565 RepID=UPI003D2978AB
MKDHDLKEFSRQFEGMGFGFIELEYQKEGFIQFSGIDATRGDKVTLQIYLSDMRVLVSYFSWNGMRYLDPSFVCIGYIKSDTLRDLKVC